MNWRGRTVEYSSDPASRPPVEVPCDDFGRCLRALPDLLPGEVLARGRFCPFLNGWGLAANNPILQPLTARSEATSSGLSLIGHG